MIVFFWMIILLVIDFNHEKHFTQIRSHRHGLQRLNNDRQQR